MANYIDTFEINTPVHKKAKFDHGHQHVTTAGWMQINPVLLKECIPGERVDMDMMTFARMQPLATPTFGRANIKERAFFVPMKYCWRAWDSFITDTPHVPSSIGAKAGIPQEVPQVRNLDLLLSFVEGGISFPTPGGHSDLEAMVEIVSSGMAYDFQVVEADGVTVNYIRLTSYGRQWYKILRSLGYSLVWDARNEDTYSALPLMALVRVFLDYYFPSQYANTSVHATLTSLLNSDMNTAENWLDFNMLSVIQNTCLYCNYDADYFVSGFENPITPVASTFSTNFSFTDITQPSGQVNQFFVDQYPENGTPVMQQGSANRTGIGTTYIHTALKALTDYMRRHQLSGSRAASRYLSRFGYNLSNESQRRAIYIDSKMVPLQIGDVMSMADVSSEGSSSNLGKFAGKGLAFEKNFHVSWETKDFGYFIVLSTIVPAAGIVQGLNRHVRHLTKSQFYTSEFDSLGVQATSTRELYTPTQDTLALSSSGNAYCNFDKSTFCFSPRYGEYKYSNDQLTGDLTIDSLNVNNANSSSWHLNRMFGQQDFQDGSGNYDFGNFKHSRAFVQGLQDHYQYNRIFQYYPENEIDMADPFTMIYDFNMVSYAPMLPLYDSYEFEDKGRTVRSEVNGVELN